MANNLTVTPNERLIYIYEKGLDVGRTSVYVKVNKVLLNGETVLNKFNNLTPAEQKKQFNDSQQTHIKNGLPLVKMDITLLDSIRRKWGGLDPQSALSKKLQRLKNLRNEFCHEKHLYQLDKIELNLKFAELRKLCIEIFQELQLYCDNCVPSRPDERTKIDAYIVAVEKELSKLEKQIDNDIPVKWTENMVVESTQSESKELIKKISRIQPVEGVTCEKVSPDEIMTDFIILRIKEEKVFGKEQNGSNTNEKIQYQLVLTMKSSSGKLYDIILLKAEGGMGKTTFLKHIGHFYGIDPSKIQGLTDIDLMLYLECRNPKISGFNQLLENLFPKTIKKCGLTFDEFRSIICDQKLLFVIDGYDEIHPGTEETVRDILELPELREQRTIISSRPRGIKSLSNLIPSEKEAVIMELLGIQPDDYEDFVLNYLRILRKDIGENERNEKCKKIVPHLKRMIPKFGTFMHSPMILIQLITLWNEDEECLANFDNTAEVYIALRRMNISKLRKRMIESKLCTEEQFDLFIHKFMFIYDKVAVKTFIKNLFVLPQKLFLEMEKECIARGIPKEICHQFLSTFLATSDYYVGDHLVKGYKYFHLTIQEHAVAKSLGMLVEKVIIYSEEDEEVSEMISILEDNKIWNYLCGKIDEDNVFQGKEQLSRYRNVLIFLVGELARLTKMQKFETEKYPIGIFEKLSDKIIDIAWHLSDDIELSSIETGKEVMNDINTNLIDTDTNISGDVGNIMLERDDRTSSTEKSGPSIRQDDRSLNRDVSSNEECSSSENIDTNSETNQETGTISDRKKEQVVEKEKTYGKEDIIFRIISEANLNEHLIRSGIPKLSSIKCLKITNGVNLGALRKVIDQLTPEKVVLFLDTDPVMFPKLREALDKLKEKRIETDIFFNGHFSGQIPGWSDEWLERRYTNIREFVGRVSEIGVKKIPSEIVSLFIGFDHTVFSAFNERCRDLTKLEELSLRIDLSPEIIGTASFRKLAYKGKFLYITLVCDLKLCDLKDKDASWVAQIVEQINPSTRKGELTEFNLQNTCLTSVGIRDIITKLHENEIKVNTTLKIWTKENVSNEDVREMKKLAKLYSLGGLQVLDVMNIDGIVPKTMIPMKSAITNNDLEKMVEDFKLYCRTQENFKEAKMILMKMAKETEFMVHKEEKYGRLDILEDGKILLHSLQKQPSVPEAAILEYEDVMSIAVQPTKVFLHLDHAGTNIGQIIIQLEKSNPRRSEHFQQLCSGDNTIGGSYLGAGFDRGLWSAGSPGEEVSCPGYRLPGADGGRGQLQDEAMFQVEEHGPSTARTAGLVTGGLRQSAGFWITTITDTDTTPLPVIGRVTSGLSDLQAAAAKGDDYVRAIRFKDCGIVINHGTTTPAAAAVAN